MTAPQGVPTRPRAGAELVSGLEPGPATPGSPDELDWVAALSVPGATQDAALGELHALMLRAARHQVGRMRGMLGGVGAQELDDVANAAADDALAALLRKLATFEGRSRFTTWAYKFAILEAATQVRRRAWSGREVALEDLDLRWGDASAGPPEHAEAADLAAAVARAMVEVLTPYQRRIAVALLVDGVPIDVLAERLATTRGALYKTLHVARARLREQLVATGYLGGAR